ncbi:MAG: putative signal transducing protein, partial [Pseudomonadota bacterium]
LLASEGLAAELLDDKAPGVLAGAYEVRVPAADAARAEAILAANPPEDEFERDSEAVDNSHDLDLETVFDATSEMEALSIQSVLESNDIDAVIVGDQVLPNLGFEVRVAKEYAARAAWIIAEAERAGPAGAEEAEADTKAE